MTEEDLFLPSGYDAPNVQNVVVDKVSGEVDDIKNLKPLDQIMLSARKFNITINDNPKKNCKKCYERGYIGFEVNTKIPIPCACLFPPKVEDPKTRGQVPLNFLSKKIQRRVMRERRKELLKDIHSKKTLKELQKIKEEILEKAMSENISGTPLN